MSHMLRVCGVLPPPAAVADTEALAPVPTRPRMVGATDSVKEDWSPPSSKDDFSDCNQRDQAHTHITLEQRNKALKAGKQTARYAPVESCLGQRT